MSEPTSTVTDRLRTEETPGREEQCPDCGGGLVHDGQRGERACEECGLVVETELVDHGQEWRAFNPREKDQKSRVGGPMTAMLHDKGLATDIDWRDTDGYGNALNARQRDQMHRLRMWNTRFKTKNPRERNLKLALGEIDRMASALGLPETVRETASVVYRRALEDDLLPGRSIEAVATAAVFAAARLADTPRSLDEVAAVSRIDETDFNRAYRYLVRELNLAVEPATPEQYLPRYASELELSDESERAARDLLESAKTEGVHSGKNPVGLAAAAIYAAALITNERLTQSEISDAINISEVTIRNRYTELLEAAGIPT